MASSTLHILPVNRDTVPIRHQAHYTPRITCQSKYCSHTALNTLHTPYYLSITILFPYSIKPITHTPYYLSITILLPYSIKHTTHPILPVNHNTVPIQHQAPYTPRITCQSRYCSHMASSTLHTTSYLSITILFP